ncbi:MAG: hypothetical protein MZV70_51510 [Desulfobacterales bacterium]|nr:hypothetical protein [Desulfobacterales bacterium]
MSTMAPAADMFELGVKVQVLKRGTMFPLPRRQALRAVHGPRQLRPDPGQAARDRWSSDFLRCTLRRGVGADPAVFHAARPQADRTRRKGPQAPNGAGVPLLPGPLLHLGHPPASRPAEIDYQIWCGPGHGRLQPVGQGQLPRDRRRTAERSPWP